MESCIFRTVLRLVLFAVVLSSASWAPTSLWACACGCGLFEVGAGSMMSLRSGGIAFLEEDFMDQNKNWNRYSRASDDNNSDKQIRTNFIMAGIQYMLDRRWGVMATLPYWNRSFSTTDANGGITSFMHSSIGDIRIEGVYTGFSADMANGVKFGIKLPSGDFSYPNFDRDTQVGTGSTDALLGGYHMGWMAFAPTWNWFSNIQLDLPVLIGGGYRPGSEVNAALGAYYARWRIGDVRVSPVAQIIGSNRWRDSGVLGHSPDSGFQRVVLSPGVELQTGGVRVYGSVGFPAYQYVNGDQLVASEFYKLNIGYSF